MIIASPLILSMTSLLQVEQKKENTHSLLEKPTWHPYSHPYHNAHKPFGKPSKIFLSSKIKEEDEQETRASKEKGKGGERKRRYWGKKTSF